MDVDDTLVLILERIASPVSLIRAATTCRRWRRVIADAGFLRRFRSLHGPPVAGGYISSVHDAVPSFVPSPSSMIDARHFSLDFLADATIFPPPSQGLHHTTTPAATPTWKASESRGSLLLMECTHGMLRRGSLFPDVVACEPLTRRYKIIPPLPDFQNNDCHGLMGPYLLDGDEDEAGARIGISMSNFRVQCVFFSHGVAQSTVFTAGAGAGHTWSDKAVDHIASKLDPNAVGRRWCSLGHVLGTCYFYLHQDGAVVTRDGITGKFSSSVLSHATKNCWDRHMYGWVISPNFFVIDGGDGEPRVVAVLHNILEVFARLDGEWVLEKKVPLSEVIRCLPGYQPSFSCKPLRIMKRGVGFIVMSPWETAQWWPFSIDLKTMEVVPGLGRAEEMAYQCEFPWPPVLQACLDR